MQSIDGDDDATIVTEGSDTDLPALSPSARSEWDEELRYVDRYLLLNRLGQGAFGVVRAAYDPELDRKVAIKLLRRHGTGTMGSTTHDPRVLLEEARMAAKLAHPNVVAIHDVGPLHATDGRPLDGLYIVMEHLGGPALIDWIEDPAHHRGWKEVLPVFLAAGQGLAAAHALGMVHRDFKPQNLRFGDDGRIRVLDFGLATLLDRLHGDGEPLVGTPAYIAPEQHLSQAIDARADQYAFCVSLWRCLYGHHPHHGASMKELAAAKLERPRVPADPSVPAWLGARIARGLEPRPEHRYPDMDALLRTLADDPIARRRRWLMGAGLTVGLMAGGYGIAVGVGAGAREDPCALPPDHFVGTWDDDVRARVAASFGRNERPFARPALREVEDGLDAYLRRWAEQRGEACRASLDRGERSIDQAGAALECLDRQLRRVTAVSTSFQQADDAVILHAAELVAALPPPASCLQPQRPSGGELVVSREAALALEGRVAQAETLAKVGDFSGSLALIDGIVADAEALGDPTSLAHARLVEAQAALDDRKYERAEQAALAAHALALRLSDPSGAARALTLLIASHRVQGHFDQAELLVRVAEGAMEHASPPVQVDHAFQVGALAQDRKQWDEAFERLAKARALAESLYGRDHLQVADIVIVQGINGSASRRDFPGALSHFEHAREIYRSHYGELHPRVASTYNNIGGVYARQGDWDRAIVEFERAVEIYTAVHGQDHPLTLRALTNLAPAIYQRGDLPGALAVMERALVLRERTLGKDNPEYVSAERNLAVMLTQAGQPRRALSLLRHVHERTAVMHGEHAPQTLAEAGMTATVAAMLGESELAARYGAIVRAGVAGVAEDEPQLPVILEYAADAADRAGDRPQALELHERRAGLLPDAVEATLAQAQIADTLLALGRAEQAHQRLTTALAELEARGDVDPPQLVPLLRVLAEVERSLRHPDAAREHYERVVQALEGSDRNGYDLALAHLALAKLASTPDDRARHASACVELLEPTGYAPERLAEARALLPAP
ncbi:serine/threonine-protein kinase [Paraliomyxa miuraensis]|uniref:serine/threonine-protein kinase n=1 Tax=Paraliomyxa miuraensis TaxID=376150 RepID=UPI0022585B97|nr:serine/threonine-protein kinase [Paraliomyxa miuraensis]MCX4240737.1 serine/threonine-protein kinase [Paraliomyxa miuraensis]